MMLKPIDEDGDRNQGPPYIKQEVQVPSKTRRLLVCCDLAFLGTLKPYSGIRFSVTDPDVHYVGEGGATFPFKFMSVSESGHWKHVEWEVDVSTIHNRRMVVGFMFPFSQAAWYIDNPRVTILADE